MPGVTDAGHPKEHERLWTILTEADCPGYEAAPFLGKPSFRPLSTGEAVLKEARVRQGSLPGEEIEKMVNGRKRLWRH